MSHSGASATRDAFDQAEDVKPTDLWPDPDWGLLGAEKAPAPPFPESALPKVVAEWCCETAEACATPVDYVVAGLLTAASGWIGNSRRVRVTANWIEPPHLWFACIGAPSTGKTPALRPFVEASHNLEMEGEDAWRDALAAHDRDAERAKAQWEIWKNAVREAAKNNRLAPNRPNDAAEPDHPIRPRVLIAESTVEEIGHILTGNPRGLLQIRDELSGWLGGMEKYSGGGGADRAFFLESWNGGNYRIDRVKYRNQPLIVRYTSLALLGGMQPDKMREALGGADDGLAARFAFVWPDPAPYRDLSNELDLTAPRRINALGRAARRLYSLKMETGEHGETPRALLLTPEAFDLLNAVRRDSSRRARATQGLASGWHGKTPARAVRLALVIELVAWAMRDDGSAAPEEVTADSVAYAATYLDYLDAMFERALASLQIDIAEADAAIVADLIVREKPASLNERELYQRSGFSFLRNMDRRRKTFDALADANFIRKASAIGAGRHRADWQVNPRTRLHQ